MFFLFHTLPLRVVASFIYFCHFVIKYYDDSKPFLITTIFYLSEPFLQNLIFSLFAKCHFVDKIYITMKNTCIWFHNFSLSTVLVKIWTFLIFIKISIYKSTWYINHDISKMSCIQIAHTTTINNMLKDRHSINQKYITGVSIMWNNAKTTNHKQYTELIRAGHFNNKDN